jgi:8-oxo-dGTP pyrophosphatase MutT (NUDIX family)
MTIKNDTETASNLQSIIPDLFFRRLQQRLTSSLPGEASQLKLVPQARLNQIFRQKPSQPVNSSVMIILYQRKGEWSVLYIRRPEYPGIHSGQIAFPGGRQEPEDSDHLDTGLREAMEETGINRETLKVAGALTPLYIPPSNYQVYPYVALGPADPVFIPDPAEVASLLEIPLRRLLHSGNIQMMPPAPEFSFMEVPAYVIDNVVIWGATAMITSELVEVVSSMEDFA